MFEDWWGTELQGGCAKLSDVFPKARCPRSRVKTFQDGRIVGIPEDVHRESFWIPDFLPLAEGFIQE
jgi:hypothetical protein